MRGPAVPEGRAATGEREPVGRAIDVLVWLATHPTPPWSVRVVARGMNTSPTTVHRIFGIFEGRGLLEKDGDGGYVPGLELYRVCHSVAGRMSPVPVVRHHLEALEQECQESVLLGAYDPKRGEMMYLDMVQSPHPIRYIIGLNEWLPVHAGASGLAIFASLPPEERRKLLACGLTQVTDRTRVTEDQLEDAVGRIRRSGYLWTRGERTVGAVGFAAPVFDAAGEVFGSLCLTIPEQRFDESSAETFGAAVLATSERVSAELRQFGYRRGLVERH
jgi:IclR family acetate operon transcriptional repressor